MSMESVFCFALLRYEEGVFNAFSTCARLIGKKPHCKGGRTALQFHVAYHFGLWVTEGERANY